MVAYHLCDFAMLSPPSHSRPFLYVEEEEEEEKRQQMLLLLAGVTIDPIFQALEAKQSAHSHADWITGVRKGRHTMWEGGITVSFFQVSSCLTDSKLYSNILLMLSARFFSNVVLVYKNVYMNAQERWILDFLFIFLQKSTILIMEPLTKGDI